MKQKRLLYLITKSNYGGGQKYVHELAVVAKETGYDVAVACGGTGEKKAHPGMLVERLQKDKIPVIFIPHFMRNMSIADDMRAFFSVWHIVRDFRPDILHVSASKAGGVGALVGRLCRVPRIIFTSHGLTMDETWRPTWQRKLIAAATWCTMRLTHHTIMISTETYHRARNMIGMQKRVSLIFNGIKSVPLLEKSEARAKLVPHLPPDTIWIGGIGELHQNKNWASLISTLSCLPEHVHAVIIGEGEERKKLETLSLTLGVANRLHLPGFKPGAPHLSAWDIFVLPSKKEGLPYVLLEAGLAKLPVVGSDLPGLHDIIIDHENGRLITPTETNMTDTLTELISDESLRSRYGNGLYETITEKFTLERMCRETFVTYSIR